ncbi:MAG: family 78 glycoside hydrolase catalytic domain, partial [Bacteroidales bacterium]|nr:family 78 glycoside hydrolase catalytic domain [Bacteroidales bacterium]
MKRLSSSQFNQLPELLKPAFSLTSFEPHKEQAKIIALANAFSFEKGKSQITKRLRAIRLIYALVILTILSAGSSFAQTIRPVSLRCEYQVDPIGIDTKKTSLTWLLEETSPNLRGQKQTGYQVLVASSPEILSGNTGDLWNSGEVDSDQNVHVIYAGKELNSLDKCYWKVRVKDGSGKFSDWSAMARWEMGLLSRADWKGNWIGSKEKPEPKSKGEISGYCSLGESSQDKIKWVQVDLGETRSFDKVILHPALPTKYPDGRRTVSNPGFGFPLRFRIDISNDPDFKKYKTILDETDSDFPNPGKKEVTVTSPGQKSRYVRFTATKLWDSKSGDRPFYFALGELQVISEDKVISLNKPALGFDSVDEWGWKLCNLTDGLNLIGEMERDHEALLLRKEKEISGKIQTATAFISGLGYYELNINGKKAGDHLLDPGFTDYTKRVLYTSYDVTDYLNSGNNCIGVILGSGWYDQTTTDAWGFQIAPWIASPKLLLNIVIDFTDGTQTVIASDESWKLSTGHIVFNSVRSGEIHDARLKKEGWDLPGYPDAGWEPAVIVPAPGGKLASQQIPPIRATREIIPVSLTEPIPGVYVYDLGVNISGWARFEIKGEKGDTVSLFYNEHLNPDGTVRYGAHTWWHYGPYQTGQFICSGSGTEIFEPRFTYHGFQYVEVKGLKKKPELNDLTGIWVHTDPDPAGEFLCSNTDINKIQELIIRTQLNNLHSIPTDCPHREKIGWMGDGLVTMEEAIYNFDMATFYIKWFRDMMDAQETDGHVPPIIPNSGWDWATSLKNPENVIPAFSDPWWGGTLLMTPWNIYKYYGDSRFIAEGYDAMKDYMDWIAKVADDHILIANLADWVEPAMFSDAKTTPKEQVGTSAYFYFARLMSRFAQMLDKPNDAEKYAKLANTIRERYNEEFFDEATGLYAENSQTAQVIPLLFEMVPEGSETIVEEQLLNTIINVHNKHLSTGFVGTPLLFQLLTEKGHSDLAYTIATQEDHPGWFYMLRNGATSIWEVW